MQKPQFVEDEIYHIYNRGVEKRKIFMKDEDYFRFLHDLFEFNNNDLTININYYFKQLNYGSSTPKIAPTIKERKPRKLLVEILVFCLIMPNHFHLLVRQKGENGIVKFMQKLGTGYTNYFNLKYERVGSLFQGRFKAVHVNKEAHFIHLPFYIHTNSLDLIYGSSTPIEKQMEFLENYRWSSYQDYIGKKNFPSLTSLEFLLKFWDGEIKYRKATEKWLRDKNQNENQNVEKIREVIFE